MTIVITKEITRADVEAVGGSERLLEAYNPPPEGFIVHVVTETATGLRAVDVWESRAQYDRFATERLGPHIRKLVAQHDSSVEGPAVTFAEALDLVRGL